ncbi:hypothetical protein VVD49_16110 [Uliginosibacterium sp. H3]|uniref:Uncharacterized protein n=1 Tax=Uliginosibacterium silvisoli TaxID=3114758 RepID=A0ABU6K8D4_9RHOO|nr:hypothetical protein [Uliginosibacterium sp. H3]
MTPDVEVMKAWQCIGCGRIDGPQTCVGVCQDRKVELVYAAEYKDMRDEYRKQLAEADALIAKLTAQMSLIVNTRPSKEQWERSFRALQKYAREGLDKAEGYAKRRAENDWL